MWDLEQLDYCNEYYKAFTALYIIKNYNRKDDSADISWLLLSYFSEKLPQVFHNILWENKWWIIEAKSRIPKTWGYETYKVVSQDEYDFIRCSYILAPNKTRKDGTIITKVEIEYFKNIVSQYINAWKSNNFQELNNTDLLPSKLQLQIINHKIKHEIQNWESNKFKIFFKNFFRDEKQQVDYIGGLLYLDYQKAILIKEVDSIWMLVSIDIDKLDNLVTKNTNDRKKPLIQNETLNAFYYEDWSFIISEYENNFSNLSSHDKNWVLFFFTVIRSWEHKQLVDYKWSFQRNRNDIFLFKKKWEPKRTTFKQDHPSRFNSFSKKNNIQLSISNDPQSWIRIHHSASE